MSVHRHLSDEEICERALLELVGQPVADLSGCTQCASEARAFAHVFASLKTADAQLTPTTDWDDLVLRSRIREAVAKEAPHSRSFWGRLQLFRPAFAAALVAVLALAVWSPFSRTDDAARLAALSSGTAAQIPAWSPLPDESEDEGLAVLAEWTPNEAELTVARCRAACLSGLSNHEENALMAVAVSAPAARPPQTESSPL